jgi:hypothetical protein
MPFMHKENPIIHQVINGNDLYNFEVDGGWQTNTAGGKNGVVFDNGQAYNSTLTLSAWNSPLFPSVSIANGKLYQTVTLDAGKYRFSAYVFAFWGAGSTLSSTSYLVAASGNDLPDITNIGNSLANFEFPFHCGDDGGDSFTNPYTIEFTLTEHGPVSLGFVGDFTDAEIHFSKVKLFSNK